MQNKTKENKKKRLRLTLGESAYTFYGFSYFFRRQTLRRGGQGNGVKERRITQPTDTRHQTSKRAKTFDKMRCIHADIFSNARRGQDSYQDTPHRRKIQHELNSCVNQQK